MDFLKDLSIDKVRNLAEDTLNQVKPKTDVEARVYEVLSHKNWGSSSTLMNEIARDTYDRERFPIVSTLMWEAMENQRPAAWRVVFKGLTLLEHLIKNGNERCVDDARNHGHILRSLGQFNYYEGTIDRGLGVREKSKQLLEILGDDDRIREERQKARKLREKFGGKLSTASSGGGGGSGYGRQQEWGSSDGGYGDGGIDSNRGGSSYDNGGYSGRYGGSSASSNFDNDQGSAPTFATLPSERKAPKKNKKKSKKKDQVPEQAPAPAPEVDLFSFDDPSPTPVSQPASGNDDFGDFQSNSSALAGGDPFGSAPAQDDFGAFASPPAAAPAFSAPPAAAPAFAAPPATADPFASGGVSGGGGGFDAFGAAPSIATPSVASGSSGFAQPADPFSSAPMPPAQPAVAQPAAEDDGFGDFADAAPKPATAASSSDPLSRLISLDGLSKNSEKEASKPVAANGGQNKQSTFQSNGMAAPTPAFGGSAMASSGGGDAISSMMGPPPVQQRPRQQPGMNAGQQAGGMMNPQMMQQMGQQMNPQMMQQMMQMNPQMMQQMMQMMSQQQSMGGNQQNMGGNMGFQNGGSMNQNPGGW